VGAQRPSSNTFVLLLLLLMYSVEIDGICFDEGNHL
jgi:hypothetical protein